MPFISRFLIGKMRDERAFGIIEALMAMTIMSLVLIALLGLLTVSVRAVSSSKLSTSANQVANQCLEDIRAMAYGDVGTVGGDPNGSLKDETRTVSGVQYTIKYKVVWVDDPSDNNPPDTDPHDYKQVYVYVSWPVNGVTKTLTATTFVRYRDATAQAPTVNFESPTPADQTVLSATTSDTPVSLKAIATDAENDLVTMRFYIGGKTPDGGFYRFDPTGSYENTSACLWYPNTKGSDGSLIWWDGSLEVVVEAWDAHGLRDAKIIHWTLDRFGFSAQAYKDDADKKNKVTVTWHAPSLGTGVTIDHYCIYRNDTTVTSTSIPLTYTDSNGGLGLPNSTQYNYKVISFDSSGTALDQSLVVSVTTPSQSGH